MIRLAGNRGALFMTIKARLLVCLSLLAVAMLVMIVTAFSALTSISKRTESIVADRLLPVDHLKTVSDMYAVEIVDTTHKVRSGALDWAAGAKAIDTALATIDTRWRTYEATGRASQVMRRSAISCRSCNVRTRPNSNALSIPSSTHQSIPSPRQSAT